MKLKLGVHWFRQDLRIDDNPSLEALAKKVDKIIPIYIFDPNQRIGSVSKWWLEQSLKSLGDSIEIQNGKIKPIVFSDFTLNDGSPKKTNKNLVTVYTTWS